MAFLAWFSAVWDLAKIPYLGRILEVEEKGVGTLSGQHALMSIAIAVSGRAQGTWRAPLQPPSIQVGQFLTGHSPL